MLSTIFVSIATRDSLDPLNGEWGGRGDLVGKSEPIWFPVGAKSTPSALKEHFKFEAVHFK